MVTNRQTFTTDRQSKLAIAAQAQAEGISDSEVVRRAVVLRLSIIDAVARMPRDRLGLTQRIAVLPEGAQAPEGSQVLGVFLPTPPRHPLAPEGAATVETATR